MENRKSHQSHPEKHRLEDQELDNNLQRPKSPRFTSTTELGGRISDSTLAGRLSQRSIQEQVFSSQDSASLQVKNTPSAEQTQQTAQISEQTREASEIPKVYIEKQSNTDITEKKAFSLNDIKTIKDLLEFIPDKYHKAVIAADKRAKKAIYISANKEKRDPKKLVEFVEKYYNVNSDKTGNWWMFRFKSKKHKGNYSSVEFYTDKGILGSSQGYREHKDEVHFSDIQRYACITDDYKEKSVNEYRSETVTNSQTLEIANALYYASIKLDPNKSTSNDTLNHTDDILDLTNDTLNFTKESAAFRVFLGTEVNLSRIYLAKDLGLSIQEVTIHDASKGIIESRWKFTPDTEVATNDSTHYENWLTNKDDGHTKQDTNFISNTVNTFASSTETESIKSNSSYESIEYDFDINI